MVSVISTLYSIVPFIFIVYYFLQMRKRKNILSDISMGLKCYSCKSNIISYESFINSKMPITNLSDLKGEPNLCLSCQRDSKIDLVFNNNKITKFDKFLISEKYSIYQRILLSLIIAFVIIDFLFKIFLQINYFSFLSPTLNIIFWYFMIKRMKLTTIKKPA